MTGKKTDIYFITIIMDFRKRSACQCTCFSELFNKAIENRITINRKLKQIRIIYGLYVCVSDWILS